jgi:replicative DNA helicase
VTANNDRAVPHSDELERMAISHALHFADLRDEVMSSLTAEDFYTPRNRSVFEVARALHERRMEIDLHLVRERCDPNARELIDELGVFVTANTEAVCQTLRSLTAARRITRAALEVAAKGLECSADPESFLELASQELMRALAARREEARLVSAMDSVSLLVDGLIQNGTENAPYRLPTPLRCMTRALGGWEGGRLYVAAGRPGMGKTALAMQAVHAVACHGDRALVFSLEMPPSELTGRLLAGLAKVDARDVEHRQVTDADQMRRLMAHAGRVAELPITYVDHARLTNIELARIARREHARSRIGIIVIDYLQLMRCARKLDREDQEIGEITRDCKALARELNVPVLLLSQLNREVEKRADKRPQMSDLRGSGTIEQDADTILFLYRGEVYGDKSAPAGLCEIIVAKQRNGATGVIKADFNARLTTFTDLRDGGTAR